MSQVIKLKTSDTASKIPEVGDLLLGEIAINTYDGIIFIRKNDGSDSIVSIGIDAKTLNGQVASYYLDFNNFSNIPIIDNVPTDNSNNAVKSKGVYNALNNKEDTLGFTPENISNKGIANGYASLDDTGTIPSNQLPAIAISNVYTVANESEQLDLECEVGDIAIRTDESKTYVHNEGDVGDMSDWSLMATPTDVVISVNSKTGAVVLDTDDINEGANKYYTDNRVLSYVGGILNDNLDGTDKLWSANKIKEYISNAIITETSHSDTTNPTNTNDVDSGYYVGQSWVNTDTDSMFILVDNTSGNAIWKELSTTVGTITTGVNIGSIGQNIYKGIDSDKLQFRSIVALNSSISVSLDEGTETVTVGANANHINHNNLENYNISEHRIINDSSESVTELYSANKILNRTIYGGTY